MKVVDIAQRTPEWHEWRKQGVSATSMAVILGYHPDKTRRQLWMELLGYATPPDLSCIPQVKAGAKLEPLALQAFEQQHGKTGLPVCAEHDGHPFIRASFDCLLDGNVPLEIKNLSENNHLEVLEKRENSSLYQLYSWQVKHQLIVSGASEGFLWFWSPKHTPVCLEVRLEQWEREELIKACIDFWAEVTNHEIPEADPYRDLLPMDELSEQQRNKWIELAEKRRELEAKIKEAKAALSLLTEQAKPLEDEFLDVMCDFYNADYAGVRITRYDIRGKVNWEALARSLDPTLDEGKINAYRGDNSSGIRMTVNTKYDAKADTSKPIPINRNKAKPTVKSTAPAQHTGTVFWL